MDDALGRHLVDDRDRLVQRALGAIHIVVVERGANRLEGAAEPRPQLTVVLPPLDVLPVRLQGGFRTLGHGTDVLSTRKSSGLQKANCTTHGNGGSKKHDEGSVRRVLFYRPAGVITAAATHPSRSSTGPSVPVPRRGDRTPAASASAAARWRSCPRCSQDPRSGPLPSTGSPPWRRPAARRASG